MNTLSISKPSINYVHTRPPSFKSQFLQTLMGVLRIKKRIENSFRTNRFSTQAATIPTYLQNNFDIQLAEINKRKVWTIRPQNGSQRTIIYIHGGGYVSNITKYDWDFVHELLIRTGATVVIPDYPLAPAFSCNDVYKFFERLYSKLCSEFPAKNMIFMGNSAGGGIALGFAQKLRNEDKPQPSQIILVSPWLDVTLSNPEIATIAKKDKSLGIKGLQLAGAAYADKLDGTDYRVSPIYGDLSGLKQISLFIGTHDIFFADAKKFREMMKAQNNSINYFEYPGMFHVWVAVTNLPESRHALQQIADLVTQETSSSL